MVRARESVWFRQISVVLIIIQLTVHFIHSFFADPVTQSSSWRGGTNYHPCTVSCGDVTAEPHQLKPLLPRSLSTT